MFSASLLCFLLLGCNHRDDHEEQTAKAIDTIPFLITQIQQCSRIYTTEYRIHKIVTYDDIVDLKGSLFNRSYSLRLPLGDRKVAIPMDATLKAYIDFSQFSEASVMRDSNKITITLPNPRVAMTASKIDQSNIREYVSLMRGHFSDRELSELELQGREAIMQSIPKLGIIEQARMSAAHLLIPIIVQLGFREEDITIVFPDGFSPYDLTKIIDQAPKD